VECGSSAAAFSFVSRYFSEVKFHDSTAKENEEPWLPGALSPLLIFARAEISCGGGKPKNMKAKTEKKLQAKKTEFLSPVPRHYLTRIFQATISCDYFT